MFHLIFSSSNGMYSACIPEDYMRRLKASSILTAFALAPCLLFRMSTLEVLKLRIPSLMIVKAGVPVTKPSGWGLIFEDFGGVRQGIYRFRRKTSTSTKPTLERLVTGNIGLTFIILTPLCCKGWLYVNECKIAQG